MKEKAEVKRRVPIKKGMKVWFDDNWQGKEEREKRMEKRKERKGESRRGMGG